MKFRTLRACLFIVGAATLLIATTGHAQFERRKAPKLPEANFSMGFFGNINTNIHSGDFTTANSAYVCEKFADGAGAGPAGGIELLYNFSTHYGTLLRLGYGSYYGSFLSERGQIALIEAGGQYQREHVWRSSLDYGTAELMFNFTPITRRIQFMVGPTFSYNLKKYFTQEEHILTVSGSKPYVFPASGTNTWVVDSGDMGGIRPLLIGAEIGVAMEFKIGRSILFTPTAYAHYFVQSPSTLIPWTVLTFKLGASIRYVLSYDD